MAERMCGAGNDRGDATARCEIAVTVPGLALDATMADALKSL